LVCQFKGDLCVPVPLYFYLLSDEGAVADYVTSLWAAGTMVAFVMVVLGCQIVIETK
jgi:hypothetical protein